MLPLSEKWAPVLTSQPETGMGYQVARITLGDGRQFEEVVIVGGIITQVAGSSDIPFCEEEIVAIQVLAGR